MKNYGLGKVERSWTKVRLDYSVKMEESSGSDQKSLGSVLGDSCLGLG